MKNCLFLFVIIMSFGNGFSKTDVATFTELQVKSMLAHKWKLKTIEAKGKSKDMPASSPQIVLHFFENGKMEELVGKDTYKGTWTYAHNKFTVTTNDKDGLEKHVILDISENLLKMSTKFMGITVKFIMSRLD